MRATRAAAAALAARLIGFLCFAAPALPVFFAVLAFAFVFDTAEAECFVVDWPEDMPGNGDPIKSTESTLAAIFE